MEAIILTQSQAEKFEGFYGKIPSQLEPLLTTTGKYAIPLSVLSDSEFLEIHHELASLPIEEVEFELNEIDYNEEEN